MSRFIVYTGGHAVAYAPTFTSEAEAEAWVNRIGENGGWEERVEIFEEECDHDEFTESAYSCSQHSPVYPFVPDEDEKCWELRCDNCNEVMLHEGEDA